MVAKLKCTDQPSKSSFSSWGCHSGEKTTENVWQIRHQGDLTLRWDNLSEIKSLCNLLQVCQQAILNMQTEWVQNIDALMVAQAKMSWTHVICCMRSPANLQGGSPYLNYWTGKFHSVLFFFLENWKVGPSQSNALDLRARKEVLILLAMLSSKLQHDKGPWDHRVSLGRWLWTKVDRWRWCTLDYANLLVSYPGFLYDLMDYYMSFSLLVNHSWG